MLCIKKSSHKQNNLIEYWRLCCERLIIIGQYIIKLIGIFKEYTNSYMCQRLFNDDLVICNFVVVCKDHLMVYGDCIMICTNRLVLFRVTCNDF